MRGRPAQAAIEAVLAEEAPDVACFQESWAEGDDTQVSRLAAAFGGHHALADPNPAQRSPLRIGNGIISRWPVLRAETRWLPNLGGGVAYRSVLAVELAAPTGRARVFCTHLDWRYDASASRQAQVAALARFVAERRGDPDSDIPPIVAGDMNAVPASDEIRALTGVAAVPVPGLVFTDAWEVAGDGTPGVTWTRANPYSVDAAWPERRLDYIFVGWPRPRPVGNPMRCWRAGMAPVDGVQPSDHYAVVADLAT